MPVIAAMRSGARSRPALFIQGLEQPKTSPSPITTSITHQKLLISTPNNSGEWMPCASNMMSAATPTRPTSNGLR